MRQERGRNERKPITLIRTDNSMRQAAQKLKEHEALAVDTEYDSFYRYRPRICLIQIGTPKKIYLIDTLAISDLAPLKDIFESPKIEKIVHDSRQDILLLKQTLQISLVNLFDTAIAARVLGTSHLGLKRLLFEYLHVKISKKERQVNWNKRPLSETMKAYAANDVRFLEDLRDQLRSDLDQAERYQEAKELFEWTEALEVKERVFNPDSFLALPTARNLPLDDLRTLKALYLWREKNAQKTNRPPFMILSDGALVKLVEQQPQNTSELRAILGEKHKTVQRFGSELLEVIHRAKDTDPIAITEIKSTKKWVKPSVFPEQDIPRTTEKQRYRYNKLLQWRKKIAAYREVDTEVIIPKNIIQELSKENSSTIQDLRERPGFGAWRKQQYGSEIIATIQEANRHFACDLCGQEFSERELKVSCPFCTARFHVKEISDYVSKKSHCPNCNEVLET